MKYEGGSKGRMKIIIVDNYDREYISDRLVADNVLSSLGVGIVEYLNKKYSGEFSSDYFKLVDDDYKLFEFMP